MWPGPPASQLQAPTGSSSASCLLAGARTLCKGGPQAAAPGARQRHRQVHPTHRVSSLLPETQGNKAGEEAKEPPGQRGRRGQEVLRSQSCSRSPALRGTGNPPRLAQPWPDSLVPAVHRRVTGDVLLVDTGIVTLLALVGLPPHVVEHVLLKGSTEGLRHQHLPAVGAGKRLQGPPTFRDDQRRER